MQMSIQTLFQIQTKHSRINSTRERVGLLASSPIPQHTTLGQKLPSGFDNNLFTKVVRLAYNLQLSIITINNTLYKQLRLAEYLIVIKITSVINL